MQGLVVLHGGEVRVASEGIGRGTEFTFWLPLDPKVACQSREATAPPRLPQGKRRILIIDDNRDAAETLRLLLNLTGHATTVAYAGPAGMEQARSFHPDVVLCDIGLPEMDGYAVARKLRQDPVTEMAYLIAVTGYGQDEDRNKALAAGFDLHLTKPVDPVELQKVLDSVPASAG